jgi:hypothetical protein
MRFVGSFEEVRRKIIRKAEREFLEETSDYAVGMALPVELMTVSLTIGDDVDEWLRNHVGEDEYLAFPNNAMGKYKDRWNWIYFKNIQDAMLFKLTWL